jgi:hypothetical protein
MQTVWALNPANSGFIINAIAATFMNSGADSVDLLPKALSTISGFFEEPLSQRLFIVS